MQYAETFHQKTGNSADGTAPREELNPRWHWDAASFTLNYHSPDSADYAVADDRDLSALKIGNAKLAAISIDRAADAEDGEVASFAILPQDTLFANNARWLALLARASGASGAETAYVAAFQGQTSDSTARVRIYSVIGGVFNALFTSVPRAIDLDKPTYCRFKVSGAHVYARFWEAGTREPSAWDIDQADGSVAGSGWMGVGIVNPDAAMVDPYLEGIGFLSVGTNTSVAYIPITREARRRFLESNSTVSTILIEAGVLGSADLGASGIDATVCISSRGFVTGAGDIPPNTIYRGCLNKLGNFSQRMNEVLQGKSTQSYGTATMRNNNGELDDWLRYNWDGRPFKVLLGSPSWKRCDFMLVAQGTVERVEQTASNEIAFRFRDGSNLLARRIQEEKVGGTGPFADRPKPLAFGHPFNCTPVLVDESLHQYMLHDGALTLLFDVRENGNSIIGSAVPDLANGQFTLTASPSGQVTADPRNTEAPYGGGHLGIFSQILFERSALSGDQIRVSLEGVEPFEDVDTAGLYIGPDYKDVDAVIDELSISQGGFAAWNRWSEIYGGRLVLDPDELPIIFDLVKDDIVNRKLKLKRLILPADAREAWYKKNYTVQDPGSIAGVVGEADRALFGQAASLRRISIAIPGSLDVPDEHILARQVDPLPTLYIDAAGVDDNFNEWANWRKTVGIFEFETRKRAMEMEIGHRVRLTHPSYGFDDGAVGIIVGMDKNYRSRKTAVELAVILDGRWPAVTEDYPYVKA